MIKHLKVEGVATGSAANTFTTVLALKLADTAGHRGRLRRLVIGGGGGAPQDLQVSVRIRKSDLTTDGTSTSVNINLIGGDADDIASRVVAIGHTFTTDPTNVGTETLGGGTFNTRSALTLEWPEGQGPLWGKGETLLIEAAPGEATAALIEAGVEWEE